MSIFIPAVIQLILNLKHLNQDIHVLSRHRKAHAKGVKFDTTVKYFHGHNKQK